MPPRFPDTYHPKLYIVCRGPNAPQNTGRGGFPLKSGGVSPQYAYFTIFTPYLRHIQYIFTRFDHIRLIWHSIWRKYGQIWYDMNISVAPWLAYWNMKQIWSRYTPNMVWIYIFGIWPQYTTNMICIHSKYGSNMHITFRWRRYASNMMPIYLEYILKNLALMQINAYLHHIRGVTRRYAYWLHIWVYWWHIWTIFTGFSNIL